jgi:stress-induced morphogen
MADVGVTAQELEEAIKSRLEATHTQVTDISGTSLVPPAVSFVQESADDVGGCGQSYEVVIVY